MPERVEKFQYLDSFSWSSKNNIIKNRIEDFINEEFQSKYLMRILPERVNINHNSTPIVKNVAWNKYGFVSDLYSFPYLQKIKVFTKIANSIDNNKGRCESLKIDLSKNKFETMIVQANAVREQLKKEQEERERETQNEIQYVGHKSSEEDQFGGGIRDWVRTQWRHANLKGRKGIEKILHTHNAKQEDLKEMKILVKKILDLINDSGDEINDLILNKDRFDEKTRGIIDNLTKSIEWFKPMIDDYERQFESLNQEFEYIKNMINGEQVHSKAIEDANRIDTELVEMLDRLIQKMNELYKYLTDIQNDLVSSYQNVIRNTKKNIIACLNEQMDNLTKTIKRGTEISNQQVSENIQKMNVGRKIIDYIVNHHNEYVQEGKDPSKIDYESSSTELKKLILSYKTFDSNYENQEDSKSLFRKIYEFDTRRPIELIYIGDVCSTLIQLIQKMLNDLKVFDCDKEINEYFEKFSKNKKVQTLRAQCGVKNILTKMYEKYDGEFRDRKMASGKKELSDVNKVGKISDLLYKYIDINEKLNKDLSQFTYTWKEGGKIFISDLRNKQTKGGRHEAAETRAFTSRAKQLRKDLEREKGRTRSGTGKIHPIDPELKEALEKITGKSEKMSRSELSKTIDEYKNEMKGSLVHMFDKDQIRTLNTVIRLGKEEVDKYKRVSASSKKKKSKRKKTKKQKRKKTKKSKRKKRSKKKSVSK